MCKQWFVETKRNTAYYSIPLLKLVSCWGWTQFADSISQLDEIEVTALRSFHYLQSNALVGYFTDSEMSAECFGSSFCINTKFLPIKRCIDNIAFSRNISKINLFSQNIIDLPQVCCTKVGKITLNMHRTSSLFNSYDYTNRQHPLALRPLRRNAKSLSCTAATHFRGDFWCCQSPIQFA